mmetsp:Transcript_27448/g.57545  ORF Transcript_27448/g.57545 Transcript_27448/m.57545 type:complete len:200 (-) Transcript_27448:70-669(-)
MHQEHVDVVQVEFPEVGGNLFQRAVVPKIGRPNLGGQKDFLPGHAPGHRVGYPPSDGGVVQVEVGPVDVAATHQQEPLDGPLHRDVVVGGGTAAHAQTVSGHAIAGPREGRKELSLGTWPGHPILGNGGCFLGGTEPAVPKQNGGQIALQQRNQDHEQTALPGDALVEIAPPHKDCHSHHQEREEPGKDDLENGSNHDG